MVTYSFSDLSFILTQIKIAEEQAGGADPASLVPHFSLPFGLRTVDGSFNNLLPGNELFGAADTLFPRMVPSSPLNLEPTANPADGETFVGITNNNYGLPGNVVDSAPRTISNLIVDMSVNNPAALQKALELAGAPDIDAATLAINGLLALVESAPDPVARDIAIQNLRDEVASHGVEMLDDFSLVIPNIAADEGLSAQFNSWFTFFGQFFDHGLDLVTKGGNGTVYVPLQPDDPLITVGPDGIAGTGDEITNPALQFIPLTRATPTNVDSVNQHENTTTSWVDQNQTYTSHASHQVFLREYVRQDRTGDLVDNPITYATGKLIDGANGGIGNWTEVKAQALTMLGIALTDFDVHNVPLLLTDQFGKFIPSATGYAQVVTAVDGDGVPTAWVSGTALGIDLNAVGAIRTGHAFLNDIAHHAGPGFVDFDHDGVFDVGVDILQVADSDLGPEGLFGDDHLAGTYDDELLGAHKVTGDGRGNENIALTTVHHVFHSEHNNLADHTKLVAVESAIAMGGAEGLAFLNEWLATESPALALPLDASEATINSLTWNGERIFQAAKFGTEMQYQHLVFEEFARKVQPLVNLFGPYNAEIDPSIVAEFAHVVYRFGHSMLPEDVARMNPDGTLNDIGLIEAFLNPIEFDNSGTADEASGAIIRGLTRQVGNEIDEFVTGALRNNLLGLPLDLPVFNIARARDTGAPSLNEARAQFYAGTGDEQLKPYESWVDFALHAKNELSVVNFIAAYGLHDAVTSAITLEDKRKAATALVLGDNDATPDTVTINGNEVGISDRFDFLNSTGDWTAANSGLNDIDLWIGGLAEAQQPFGGLLGSTFNFVFETQMENLQDSDRFYYLNRLAGTHFLTELEGNSFAQMVINNTNLGEDGMHLPGDIFSVPNFILEVDQSKQVTGIFRPDQLGIDGNPLPGEVGREDPAGGSIFNALVIRDNPNTPGPDTNYLKFTGGEHVVLGGTNPGNLANSSGNDILIASIGDDTIWGDGGNDRIEGGAGVDQLLGGAGDDIITDINGDDNIKGQGGNDVINSGDGFDLILAGDGNDFTVGGEDANETFGGEGNDFMFAGDDADVVFGDAGDDWIEGGPGVDLLQGDFGAPFQDSAHAGNDVIIGGAGSDDYDSESGDDIMLADDGIERNEGMLGFDWVSYKYDVQAANADLFFTGLLPPDLDAIRDRFDLVEGLSGWDLNDTLRGDNADSAFLTSIDPFAGHNNAINNQAQIDLVAGLQDFLGAGVTSFSGGNIILGGGGSDVIEGRGGDDVLDGDAKLNVRLAIHANLDGTGAEIGTADGMTTPISSLNPALNGKSLVELMFNKTLNPGQLSIVREIITNNTSGIDVAQYSDIAANYIVSSPDVDGFITIEHNIAGVAGADGTDRVRNFELVQFADSTLILDPSITNDAPASTLVINDLTPLTPVAVGDTLSVGGTVTDPDNVTLTNPSGEVPFSSLNIIWQVEQTPGAGDWIDLADPILGTPFTGPTLTITAALVADILGLSLRVRATFVDAHGFPESVVSAASDPVSNLTATEGDDILTGGPGPDVIQGLGGDDIINSLGGDDILIGGRLPVGAIPGDNAGNDILDGGTGNDTARFFGSIAEFTFVINAEGQLEVVHTATGEEDAIINIETLQFDNAIVTVADLLDGSVLIGTDADEVFDPVAPVGGDFFTTDFGDEIDARGGADTITAGAGFDLIGGGDGDDIIDSGGGNDTVGGGSGTNTIRLRPGDETLLVGLSETGTDTVRNDGGTERISIGQVVTSTGVGLTPPNAGTVSLTTEAATAVDSLTAVDDGAGNLLLTVNAKAVTITDHFNDPANNAVELITFNNATFSGETLAAGDYNLIAAAAGTTTLLGTVGNDALFGTGAVNLLVGGAGNDVYFVDATADAVVEGNDAASGIDTVVSTATYTLGANVENLILIDAVITNGTGNALANRLVGNDAVNTLSGLAGNDTLVGNDGNDNLQGGADNDTYVIGLGDGNDQINETGGTVATGNADRIVIATGGAALTALNAADNSGTVNTGNLVLAVNGQTTIANNHFALVGGVRPNAIELINFDGATFFGYALGSGDYTINTTDAATVTGTAGNDLIAVDGGTETLNGLAGNDLLFGNAGTDTLNGGDNDDLLAGGTGTDALNGGTGNDTYLVNVSDGADTITETGGTADRIVIRTAGAALTGLSFSDDNTGIDTGNLDITYNGQSITVIDHFDNTATDEDIEFINFDNGSFGGYAFGAGDYTISTSDPADTPPAPNARTVSVASGNNLLAGETGANRLTGGTGRDLLFGFNGADTLTGGGGDDLLVGGAGTDTAVFSGVLADYSLTSNASGNLVVTDNRVGSPDGVDTLIGVERAIFGATNFSLRIGTAGADSFAAGTPPEIFLGFGGSDTVVYAGATAVVASLVTGSATNGDRYFSIENLTGGTDGDTLTGDGLSNTLSGGGGADALNGGAGGDVLIGGALSDTINTGAADDNLADSVRYTATGDYIPGADPVTNFDATGTAAQIDRVEFGGALDGLFDDGNSNGTILFASGNEVAASAVAVTVGQANANAEALYLSGANGEGVTGINLANAAQVATAFNLEFTITAANGEDALLVINDTDGNNFAVWQWIQAGGGEIAAAELTLIGTFQSNGTVTTASFDFV